MVQESKPEVKLKVMEALQEEAYKGIVRIDSETMHAIDVRQGGVVEIEGTKKTVGIVDRAYPTDVGQAIIRMDGIMRRNAKTGIGEVVKVRKADVKEAKSITIAPAQKGVTIQADPVVFKRGLLGRAVVKGDQVALGGARSRRRTMEGSPFEEIFEAFEQGFMGPFGLGGLKFIVVDVNPKQAVIITENTIINLNPKAVEIPEEKVIDVTYEDIGGLDEELKKVRELVETPLRHPELFQKLGIDPPAGILLYGPPGSGKTLLAKAVANESEANFILLNGPEVMNKFYGESERKVRELFEEAEKNSPSIIFIDEIDAIAPKREEVHGEVERRVVSQLLCLHPDTPVYLKEGTKSIKDLFDDSEGNSFVDEYGVVNKIPSNPIYVQSLSPEGKISASKVIALTKTNIPKAFKIKLENGSEVITSEITKFLSIDDSGVYWKNANNISPNDFVFVPRKLQSSNEIHKIDIFKLKEKAKWILKLQDDGILRKLFGRKYASLEELDNLIKYHVLIPNSARNKITNILLSEKKSSKEDIERLLKINRATLNNYLRPLLKSGLVCVNNNVIRLIPEISNFLGELVGIARKEDGKIYPIKDKYFIKLPEVLDEDLAKLLGLIISDGNLQGYRVNVSGETSHIALGILKKRFGVDAEISFDKNLQRIDINSRPLVFFLNQYFNIPIGKKSHNVAVPSQLFASPDSVKSAFLAGLIEGDGSIYPIVSLNSKSQELVSGVSVLLLQLGIISRIKKYGVYTLKVAGGYESFERFNDTIAKYITLERKKEKLNALISKVKKFSTVTYPIKSSLKKIRDEQGVRLDDNKYRYLSPTLTYNINSNVLGYFIQKLDNIENQFVQEIKHFYNSEAIPCRVVDVEIVDGGIMYDLTTESSNFLAGKIPIVLHNTMMDGLKSRSRVVVIGATNRPNAIDPALRRPGRFDREIQIGVPGKKARLEILKIHTRNMPLTKDVKLEELAEVSHGFVGADLSALAKEAAMNVLRKVLQNVQLRDKEPVPQEILDKIVIEAKDFKDALKIVRPSALREVLIETPNVGWSDIGGLDGIKQELIEAVEWPIKNPDAFKRLGIRPPRGLLLYGPPGTGKTLLAKAVAKESEANFILVKGPTLLNMWVGESEKGVRQIFERARQTAPTIIFFDELDAIAPRRGFDTGSKVTERIVNTLLAEMDGLEELHDVVVIGATNRPDILDPALLRPGRFDRLVLTPQPDEASRLEIFKIHVKDMPLAKDIKLEELAKRTEGYSGSDLEAVCREAAMLALREDIKTKEVKKKFFEKALEKVRPSIPKETMDKYKAIEDEYLRSAKAALQRDKPGYFG